MPVSSGFHGNQMSFLSVAKSVKECLPLVSCFVKLYPSSVVHHGEGGIAIDMSIEVFVFTVFYS